MVLTTNRGLRAMTTKTKDGKEVLEDGERFVANVMLMDAQQRAVAALQPQADALGGSGHRPGYAMLSDAERERRAALYRDHDERLSARWQSPSDIKTTDDATRSTGDARLDAYARYQDRVTNAWRGR